MATAETTKDYWGYLIEPDKTPTPLLRDLLLGIANYIVSKFTVSLRSFES